MDHVSTTNDFEQRKCGEQWKEHREQKAMFKSKEIFLDATMGSVIDLSYSDEQVK